MDINGFRQSPVLGILRGVEENAIEPLAEAIALSGLKTVEITMNTKDAPDLIKKMVKAAKGHFHVGAGTVLTMTDMNSALDAGASFIVSPTLIKDVTEHCASKNIPVFPGALTPQEIHNAWMAGATMVKVFPARFFGPEYFKEVKGPFNDIELLACGGINSLNVKDYFSCGASAVAFGGSIFKNQWLEKGEFFKIEHGIKELLSSIIS